MSIEERIKTLEKKVLKLEGNNPLKAKAENPYKSDSTEEISMRV